MKRYCIYKLKEGKALNGFEEQFSQYAYVEDFAKNPLNEGKIYVTYRHIDINTLDYSNSFWTYVLPPEKFKEYFDLYMDTGEINEKLRELEGE